MTFSTPIPLEDALRILRDKKLVPTALGSAGLQELAAEVKNAALFSARMTQLRPLQVLAAVLAEMIQGQANVADAKLVLTEVYRALGYDPEQGGFPQDAPGTIPPAMRGTLRDLSSERRMELTVTTNYRMVTNAAFVKRTTEDEQRRYQFPCFELVRIAPRGTPRGFVRRKGGLEIKPGDDWTSRWVAAGGELFERNTRMIALKGAAVWTALGAGEGGYTDTLGNPFPPFAFGSGMGLREVSRGEALTIGVISPEDEAAAMPSTLRASLKAQAKALPKDILDAFDDLEDDGEWLRLAKDRQLKAEAARRLRNRVAWLGEVLLNARTKDPRAAALQGWITRREGKAIAGEAWDYTHPKGRFLRGKPRSGKIMRYKRVDSAEALRVKKATGLDVAGKYHALDDEYVRHTHKEHGDPKAEARRGQHAVGRKELSRLHQLHSTPDVTITDEGIDKRTQLRRIKTVGRVGRKKYSHIEEVHPTHLRHISLWLNNRKKAVVANAAPARVTPTETPEAFHSSFKIVDLRARCKLLADLLSDRS